jgi:enoyl-CoA hydratase/carnithine racemase
MSYEQITTDVAEHVLTITLNRPDRLNAWTPTMGRELIAAFDDADRDDDVRVVIVTGAGRGFCAGADLAGGEATFDWRQRLSGDAVPRDGGGRFTLCVFDCTKPVIAAINGPAVGVGVTMTLPMDIRLAADDARLGFVFTRRGIVPEACSSWFLPRLVGISRAMEWVSTGRLFGAEHPMLAHRADSRGMFLRGQSADAAEGVTSFLEKRPAAFSDRVSDGLPEVMPAWRAPHFE